MPKSEVIRIKLQLERQYAFSDELNGKLKKQQAELGFNVGRRAQFYARLWRLYFSAKPPKKPTCYRLLIGRRSICVYWTLEQLLQAQARALAADSKSDITVGVGARYNNEFDDVGLIVQASMPLQFTDPNVGRIKQSRLLHQSILAQQKTGSAATKITGFIASAQFANSPKLSAKDKPATDAAI